VLCGTYAVFTLRAPLLSHNAFTLPPFVAAGPAGACLCHSMNSFELFISEKRKRRFVADGNNPGVFMESRGRALVGVAVTNGANVKALCRGCAWLCVSKPLAMTHLDGDWTDGDFAEQFNTVVH